MQCPQCNRALPYEAAAHCPYCGATITNASVVGAATKASDSGQPPSARESFCVKCGAKLPPEASFCTQCSTPRPNVVVQQPGHPVVQQPGVASAQLVCPRCGSTNTTKGKIAQWALIAGIVLAPFTCFLSLLLLLVKDPNRCQSCAYEFK